MGSRKAPQGRRGEAWRGALGAGLALLATGWLCRWELAGSSLPWLIAPMGASAVLLFCLPASPLAQPWAVFGGNVVSALAGLACLRLGLPAYLAAPLAGGLAIAAMAAARCLHPPGGAVALTMVFSSAPGVPLAWSYAAAPVALNSALMVAAALLYHRLGGHRYPHRLPALLANVHGTRDAAPTARLGVRPADLDAVLARYGEALDVDRADLEELVLQTEAAAYARRYGSVTCADAMSADVVTVVPGTPLDLAWLRMRQHRVHALPVLDGQRRVVGIVTQGDLLRASQLDAYATLAQRLRLLLGFGRRTVAQAMTPVVHRARPDQAVAELIPLMTNAGRHHVPVIDAEGRLAGILTQSDVLAALYASRLADLDAA
ncbi:MAG: HPP family protein [Telluria sp.]